MMKTSLIFLKKHNSYYILIPLGLTWFIQPLDISINGPFKRAMHNWDIDFQFKIKMPKSLIPKIFLNDVVGILYNDALIKPNNIITSFKCTGISINLNGSEQELVHKHDEICDEIIILNDVILNSNVISIVENIYNNLNLKKEENTTKDGICKITDYFSKLNEDNMDIE